MAKKERKLTKLEIAQREFALMMSSVDQDNPKLRDVLIAVWENTRPLKLIYQRWLINRVGKEVE